MRIIVLPCLALSLAFGQNLTPSTIPLSALNVGVVDPYLNVPAASVAVVLQQGLGGQILPAKSPNFAFTDNSAFASASADTSKTLRKVFASGMLKTVNATQRGARWNLYFNAIECKQGTDQLYHTLYAVIPVFEVLPNTAQGITDTVYATLGEPLRLQITTRSAIDVNTTSLQQVNMEPALNPGLSPKSFAQMMQDLLKRTTKYFVLR
jgi:hypothetical protein